MINVMNKNFDFYDRLINGHDSNSYWNLVVITALNTKQKESYERQIEIKLNNNRLPRQFDYWVISDPENHKIGNGGSTLHVLKCLFDRYEEDLFEMKILLIHAGGYSQRMPSCSILGKIFYSIACDNEYVNDILDVKLALYTPFALNMTSGVFLTSSDDIETFDLKSQFDLSHLFSDKTTDFLLIAHKSSLDIAKNHGCYALGDRLDNKYAYECEFVLQKPSIEAMHAMKIVNDDQVYTDSVFYFSSTITQLLIKYSTKYLNTIIESNVDVDAYRDFLQPLGRNPLSYENYSKRLNDHEELFNELYQLLNHKKALILALDNSKFYHLGTTNELLEYYLNDDRESNEFRKNICFKRVKNSIFFNEIQGCVQHTLLHTSLIGKSENYLLENCVFDYVITLNNYCYLNNCRLLKKELSRGVELPLIEIPNDICMHTISIKEEKKCKYVTIYFKRDDDLKKLYDFVDDVTFLGKKSLKNTKCEHELIHCDEKAFSIWNLKLFSSHETMSAAFLESYRFLNMYLQNDPHAFISNNKYSLFDLLRLGDFESMLYTVYKNNFNTLI